MLLKFF